MSSQTSFSGEWCFYLPIFSADLLSMAFETAAKMRLPIIVVCETIPIDSNDGSSKLVCRVVTKLMNDDDIRHFLQLAQELGAVPQAIFFNPYARAESDGACPSLVDMEE